MIFAIPCRPGCHKTGPGGARRRPWKPRKGIKGENTEPGINLVHSDEKGVSKAYTLGGDQERIWNNPPASLGLGEGGAIGGGLYDNQRDCGIMRG
jgi:hypothetical protein